MRSLTMQILIDHNIEGFAPLLLGVLAKEGWVELLSQPMWGGEDVHGSCAEPLRTTYHAA